jgi:uncharacterized protein (DUF111 family)
MRIVYFDCFSGISGDMVLGALVDAGVDFDRLCAELTKLPLDGYRLERRRAKKHEIVGTKIDVVIETPGGHDVIEGPGDEPHSHSHSHHDAQRAHDHAHAHPHPHEHAHHHDHEGAGSHSHEHSHAHGPGRRLPEILRIIEQSALPESVRHRAAAIFDHLAGAEGVMHGMAKDEVTLHEVSGIDAIVDITGTCIGLHLLEIEEVYASALPLGSGFIRCAHGRMPVPAPGALELLRGVPVYQTATQGELVTPTGAAILKGLATQFGPMPRMVLERVGYGAGTKDIAEHPNLLRVCIGTRG